MQSNRYVASEKNVEKPLDKHSKSSIIRMYQGKGNRQKPNDMFSTWFPREKRIGVKK